ncbi:alpha/beta fold hydrolase [Amorphus sp. 3PC139-8]|uniref:alpha/beta fold hydrolase n=1 Tax=Amorphus sp. 3PC139-8 TaxID=2735676 RepID=UPI00345D15B7
MTESTGGLHVRETGAGRPILFLHGWSCHGGFFADANAGLADRFHCLAPDLPGHGLTGTDGPALSIEAAADACAALLAERDLSNVVLVGWSMGVHVAYAVIERHGRARISALASLDMTPKIVNDGSWTLGISGGFDEGRNRLAQRLMRTDWTTYAGALTQNMFADGVSPTDAKTAALLDDVRANDPEAMVAMWDSLAQQDFRALQPTLDLPVLLIHGAKSRIYDLAVGRHQVAQFPRAELEIFKQSGHSPHLEEPEAFIRLLGDFAARV